MSFITCDCLLANAAQTVLLAVAATTRDSQLQTFGASECVFTVAVRDLLPLQRTAVRSTFLQPQKLEAILPRQNQLCCVKSASRFHSRKTCCKFAHAKNKQTKSKNKNKATTTTTNKTEQKQTNKQTKTTTTTTKNGLLRQSSKFA